MNTQVSDKSKLIALGLAGSIFCFSAPVSAAYIGFSGIVEVHAYLQDDNLDDDGLEKKQHISAGDVRLQANISEKFGAYTGYATYRIDADGLSGTELTSDSITVGLKGNFGDLALGEVTKVAGMGELANDMHGFNSDSEEHIGYTNNFGPISLALTHSPESNQDQTGIGLQYNGGGLTIGAGYDTGKIGDENLADESGLIVGVKYSFGGSSIAIHSGKRDTFKVTAIEGKTSFAGWDWAATYSTLDDVSDIARLNVSKSLSKALTWGFRYENTSPETGDSISFFRTSLALSF